MQRSKLVNSLVRQAQNLIDTVDYFREHPDENVYIHWKQNQPYLLPHKMSQKEARLSGFESVVNTVRLSTLLNQKVYG